MSCRYVKTIKLKSLKINVFVFSYSQDHKNGVFWKLFFFEKHEKLTFSKKIVFITIVKISRILDVEAAWITRKIRNIWKTKKTRKNDRFVYLRL